MSAESQSVSLLLAETTSAALFVVQGEGMRITYANRGAEMLTGYPADKLLAMAWSELIQPEMRAIVLPHLQSQLRGEAAPARYETQIVSHGGDTHWVDVSASRVACDKQISLMLLLLDITARKRAEEALRENDRLLHRILNATREGITVLDRDLTILRTNRVMEERCSHAMPLVGSKCHVAYRRSKKACPDCPVRAAIKKRAPQTAEVPRFDSEGRQNGWVELVAVPLREGPDGAVTQIVEFARDITGRRRHQKEVETRLAFESCRARIGLLFSSATNSPDVRQMLQLLGEVLAVDGAAYYEVSGADTPSLENVGAWSDEDGPSTDPWPTITTTACACLVRQPPPPEPVAVEDARAQAHASKNLAGALLQGRGIRSLIAFPLHSENRLVGLLEVGNRNAPRAWTEDEHHFLQRTAEMLTHHIERRESDRRLAKRLDLEAGLAACSRALLSDDPQAIDRALAELLRISEACRAYIFQNSAETGRGICMCQRHEACTAGVNPQIDNPLLRSLPYANGYERWRRSLSNGQAIEGEVSGFPETEQAVLEDQGILSLLVLPIRCRRKWWGFIGFDDTRRRRRWSAEDKRLLRLGSEMIALYIERREAAAGNDR